MGTSVLGHNHTQFQIAGIQEFKDYSSYHSSNEYNFSHKEQECGLKKPTILKSQQVKLSMVNRMGIQIF